MQHTLASISSLTHVEIRRNLPFRMLVNNYDYAVHDFSLHVLSQSQASISPKAVSEIRYMISIISSLLTFLYISIQY
jgi:hypothetical protein